MKKIVLLIAFIAACATFTMAADIDTEVKNAVDSLASRLTSPIDVSVGEIYQDGTTSPSGLSQILANRINAHAPNTGKFKLVPLSRGVPRPMAGGSRKGIITGTYQAIGDTMYITLQLLEYLSDGSTRIAASQEIKIPLADLERERIDILPANFKTQEEVKEQENLFVPPPAPSPQIIQDSPSVPSVNVQTLQIFAWPNSDTNTYIDGDAMTINIEASQDCYFMVWHIDVENIMQLIYPRGANRNNRLLAHVQRTIPESGKFNIQAPFGQDTIIVNASSRQFPNIDSEIQFADAGGTRRVTRDMVENVMRGRGMGYQPGPEIFEVEAVTARFNFTSLPATYAEKIYSYRNPSNIGEAIQAMRAEVILLGGVYDGDISGGSYTLPGIQGRFWANGDTVMLTIRNTSSQSITPNFRGAGLAYSFSIDKPRNMAQAVQAVKSGIEGKGGTFSGNEQQGSFSASGISGRYQVSDRVNVSITEKPFVIPNSLIEKEIRNYFAGK